MKKLQSCWTDPDVVVVVVVVVVVMMAARVVTKWGRGTLEVNEWTMDVVLTDTMVRTWSIYFFVFWGGG